MTKCLFLLTDSISFSAPKNDYVASSFDATERVHAYASIEDRINPDLSLLNGAVALMFLISAIFLLV